jgi:bile acid-coenzyme A ligase
VSAPHALPVSDDQLHELGVITYAEALSDHARQRGGEPALIFAASDGGEEVVTWEALVARMEELARGLVARGVERGRTVAAVLPNSPGLVALGFATWRAGGCFLPVSAEMPGPEREAMLGLMDPAVVVSGARSSSDHRVVTVQDLRVEGGAWTSPMPHTFASPGKAIGSGGSTGRPKAIVTKRLWGWVRGAEDNAIWRSMGIRPGMRHLVSGPLYHNWGFDLCFIGLAAGSQVVLMERFEARRAVDLIRRHRIEYAGLVPTTMRRIEQLPDLDPVDLESLEAICHTAAPCPPALKRRWIELLGAERVYEIYGGSEGFGICALRGDEWLAHTGSVGRPIDSEVLIVDSDERPLPPREVGTIYLRRRDPEDHATYRGAPEAPATAEGFRSLGDLGWLDEDGFLYLADRRADLIITGGVNVYPAEVEAALAEHPAIAESVVFGVPDAEWGKCVHAVVELREGSSATQEDIRTHCAELLSKAKVPKTVEFVEQLPRSDAGKIRRNQLAAERSDISAG